MINMSYCRFENTKLAWNECEASIRDREDISDNEAKNLKYLLHDVYNLLLDENLITEDFEFDNDRLNEIIHEMQNSNE